ncbi:MAG: sulfur carrier protein ThiS [Anaerolineaceae bacterium]|nr:sulfur carrier protein ThiS [Anaerolineaceae bacterium]
MIKVNTKEYPWHNGMTVQVLLDEKVFTFKHIVVRVNGVFIPEELYSSCIINDGDDVVVLHLMAGG